MRNIPVITKNLLLINIIAFVACMLLGGGESSGYRLNDLLGLHFFLAPDFHIYQLFTYMFMHGGFTHILFNMFALWMFGCVVENVWGSKKFLFYYISCGVGAGLFQEAAQYVQYVADGLDAYTYVSYLGQQIPMEVYLNKWTTVGASGAIYAILLAFGMLFPEERMFIFPLPVPIKAKWFVIGYAAIELFSAVSTTGDGVAHVAHLGGMVFGFFMIRYWKKHPGGGYGRMRGQDTFERLRNSLGGHRRRTRQDHRQDDWDYRAQQRAMQEEIDRILDKIRKSGYDSLTKEEKQKLFEQSKGKS